jgi:hypothetical protein
MQNNMRHYRRVNTLATLQNIFAAASIAVLLPACTTINKVELPQDIVTQLTGKKIALTKYQPTDFYAMTAAKATLGLIGALVSKAEGNHIVETRKIEDPAQKISADLADRLVAQRGMILVSGKDVFASSDNVDTLVSSYPGADYLVDVKTTRWSYNYFATDWDHYRVMYNSRFRLIDTATKIIIAEGACTLTQTDALHPPTGDQLLANNALLLKGYLNKTAVECADIFSADPLKLAIVKNLARVSPSKPVAAQKPPINSKQMNVIN